MSQSHVKIFFDLKQNSGDIRAIQYPIKARAKRGSPSTLNPVESTTGKAINYSNVDRASSIRYGVQVPQSVDAMDCFGPGP